jgi:hypothetical protein
MHHSLTIIAGSLLALSNLAQPGGAAVVNATPSNYGSLLNTLKPGDTLNLASGTYSRLNIRNLNGVPDAWITITGPLSGPPAIIAGAPESNTVEILNSSYLAIENLRIDSRGIPGAAGISARYHEENLTHHIRIEGNTLVGQNGGQQTDGISTKTPTWGWVIRYNRILGAGTGIYLGDSDGTQPFVAGIIEHNLIQDTIGYDMEIKDQISIPAVPGMPTAPSSTIIRNNVFIKNDQPSPDGDRPNLLVGAFPATGTGSLNMYEIYGNFFIHNHREALFQGSGRVTLHDNIFVDGPYEYPAVVLRKQNNPLQIAYVYHNTVYTSGRGIYFGTRAMVDDAVVGNLVFASKPISGSIMRQSGNLADSLENASKYVNTPSFDKGAMDFYPLPSKCQGAAVDLTLFPTDEDYTLDFNGTFKASLKGAVVFRGAYAGEGSNPGWQLQADMKAPRPPAPNPTPALVWINPASGQKGITTPVTLTGANFAPGTTVTVSGSGVKTGAVTVDSPTQITVPLTIAATAEPGARDIAVSSASGKSNTMKFQIRPRQSR